MSGLTTAKRPAHRWTPAELRGLPAARRDAILKGAAKCAEADYVSDRDLTDFEAFGKKELHGRSASSQSR
jgi:hypothetical protein